ncbi:MAG: efflux RND transporter periplasmic adaptor subunit [Parabacteroides sp.]|nr:efflux RND transporter periplasmic adaptor subunit [Parabacteroides sp.]MDY4757528.1 efflux RND transporter periplasmic adaptor subunit [Parabacteroides sp.]
MKKIYGIGVLCAYLLAGCAGHSTEAEHDHDHEHEEAAVHDHEHEGHDHEHEEADHDHEHEEAGHDHEHDHEHEHEAAANPGEVVFKEANAKAVGLQTITVTPGAFTQVIRTSGQVLAAQGEESVMVATVPGVVSFGSVPFTDGTAVRKGQAVLSIASNGLSEGDVAVRAKAAYEAAKLEFERMEALVADRIVSAKEFEQAKLNYANAKAAYEAVADKQTAKGVAVVAPLNGYLKNIQVKEGDYVSVGQPLATIAQSNRLMLRADVSERYYSSLPMVQSAHFKTPYDEQVYRLADLRGRLLSYGRASGGDSFFVPVTFEFDNKGAILPGSFVEVYLLTKPLEQVISVPVESLIEEQGLYSVYVRLDADCYRKQPVTLGANNGVEVQILSGLHGGEAVVTKGAHQVKLASASNAIPAHSHSH